MTDPFNEAWLLLKQMSSGTPNQQPQVQQPQVQQPQVQQPQTPPDGTFERTHGGLLQDPNQPSEQERRRQQLQLRAQQGLPATSIPSVPPPSFKTQFVTRSRGKPPQ